MAKNPKKGTMSKEHKASLAVGRREAKAVREYLEALRAYKPKRGPKVDLAKKQARLEAIETELETASALDELLLVQERRDITAFLETHEDAEFLQDHLARLEEVFVVEAANYAARKKISYASWREVGVEPAVLKRAGITRGK